MRLIGEPRGIIENWGEVYQTGRIVGTFEGREILTSCVVAVDVDRRVVQTKTGSLYELGAPHTAARDIESLTPQVL